MEIILEGFNGAITGISREALQGTALRDAVALQAGHAVIATEDELDRSRAEAFQDLATDEDVWIFGYGSLVWNPIFPVAERRKATLFGFHRAFCLESTLGRGSTERPGLMLALDVGGSCTGVALKLERSGRDEELRLLWRREMLHKSYRAVWVKVRTDDGVITALTFVADRKAANYLGRVPLPEAAAMIAGAAGLLGTNLHYLTSTCTGLADHGIEDPYLSSLLTLCQPASGGEVVAPRQSSVPPTADFSSAY